jgi:hypothetical protein
MVHFIPGALHLCLELYPDPEHPAEYRLYPDQQAMSGTLATPVGHFATGPIPLTDAEAQQLIAVVHAIAARITLLVNAPTEVDAADPPA